MIKIRYNGIVIKNRGVNTMPTVTQVIKQIKKPSTYLKPSQFTKIQFEDNFELGKENIAPSLVGTAVDYMTRFVMGTSAEDAFKISRYGALNVHDVDYAAHLLSSIQGIDEVSIYSACQLVGYDVCYRVGSMAYTQNVRTIEPDSGTINNIRIMLDRSVKFFDKYGPIIKDGFGFEGAYTKNIDAGDGDFLTKDTLWDFKVSSSAIKSGHALQLLIYYIMGKHSVHKEFDGIKNLGVFNPRLNCIFIKEVDQIPVETIQIVSRDIIGYKE